MSEKTSHSEEEIDLGQLFVIIGRGIDKIIQGFIDIFMFSGTFLMSILTFFIRNYIGFGLIIILGFILGGTLEKISEDKYVADMVVKPNFGSTRQLYNNIEYYNELVKQEDSILISETFNISLKEASSIKSFKVAPIIDDNNLLESYDIFLASVDSSTVVDFDFEQFVENFSIYSYYYHVITIVSTQNDIFIRLDSTILSSIENNDFFKNQKNIKNESLFRNNAYLNSSIIKVDSLRSVYNEVLLSEAKKSNLQGTNINLGDSKESTKEIDLFAQEARINRELDVLGVERVEYGEVLNVVSDFQRVGFKMNTGLNRPLFIFPIVLFALLVFFFLLRIIVQVTKKRENMNSKFSS
jgi:hypothetical protein